MFSIRLFLEMPLISSIIKNNYEIEKQSSVVNSLAGKISGIGVKKFKVECEITTST